MLFRCICKTIWRDPKRFNMLFGESKFKNPYKVIQGLGNTFDKVEKWEIGNNGALIAQTLVTLLHYQWYFNNQYTLALVLV